VIRTLALAAAAAALVTAAAPAPHPGHRVSNSPFGNGGSGPCVPNAGNWEVTRAGVQNAGADWTSRPAGCYLRVKVLFKTSQTSGYSKYSGAVTELNFWAKAFANDTSANVAGAWYQWRHCGATCGSWSSLHQFYP